MIQIHIIAPLFSIFLAATGNSLFMTLFAFHLKHNDFGRITIGFLSSAFYMGFVLSAKYSELIIAKIGHIRTFSALAAMMASSYLIQAINADPILLFCMRLIDGFTLGGLCVVVESWLLHMSDSKNRGSILSLYMVVYYSAQSLGQFLLDNTGTSSLLPFMIASIFAALSVIPTSLFPVHAPRVESSQMVSFLNLFKLSPSGFVGSFCSGLILAPIYSLYPLYLKGVGFDEIEAGNFMGIVILGGMALQYPFGKLSDFLGRRRVIAATNLLFVILCFFMSFDFAQSGNAMIVLTFIFGGLAFIFYPLSLSLVCDKVEEKHIVSVTSGIFLAYGVGAILGPVIAPIFMSISNTFGMYIYLGLIALTFGVYATFRDISTEGVPLEDQHDFIPVMQTSSIIGELDPRSSDDNHDHINTDVNNDKRSS